ncbi:MAG: FAD:protein FMN transferase, partial [Gammaproteobacteria bacterium]|nr:FAD:protein FMN transferase [Gammaproteobacteria bacterium]
PSPALRWQGRLLGAPAEVTLYHPERARAAAALAALAAEVARLDVVFSLHRDDSALARLNRAGRLDAAPAALCELLATCAELHAASDGAFDPTVQPLWDLYAAHFAAADATADGPSAARLGAILARVGFDFVRRAQASVAFTRAGVALTLNGIAQGYVTDRARALLAAHGMPHALVNLGEYAALGPRPDGGPWRVAIAHPEVPWRMLGVVELRAGAALATSAGAGTAFDAARRYHHLLDPRTGRSSASWRSVSVCAPSATLADGLSTALAVAAPAQAEAILARYPAASALVLDQAGRRRTFGNGFPLA